MFKAIFCGVLLIGLSGQAMADDQDSRWLGVSDFAEWSHDGSKIVFHSSRDGNFEIYIMDADGANQNRLTHNPWSDANPSMSPDGQFIAFNSNREGWGVGEPTGHQIYIMDINGDNLRDLTREGFNWGEPKAPHSSNIYPRWGKNGEILYLSNRANGFMEIYLIGDNGENRRQVSYHRQHHYNVFWSPDQSRIFFDTHVDGMSSANGDGGWDIQSVNTSGGEREDVTNNRNYEDYDGTISPDGTKIIYNRSGSPGLFIMNADGSGQSNELFIEESAFSPRWSPDGKSLVFTSSRDGHRELYLFDLETREAKRLTWSRGE